ncbi:MAG: hypothetical protein OXM88_14135, partial [bacterium]|nr:hypothetical protein [bacterium]
SLPRTHSRNPDLPATTERQRFYERLEARGTTKEAIPIPTRTTRHRPDPDPPPTATHTPELT